MSKINKIIILIGILLILLQTLLTGSGNIIDFIFHALGVLVLPALIAYVTYLLTAKKTREFRLNISSITFLLISIASLLGLIYRNQLL